MAEGAIELVIGASTDDRVIPAFRVEIDCGPVFGGLGAQVDGAADAVSFHAGLQGFVDLYGLNEVGRNKIQLNLPSGFRRCESHAIEGRVGEARLGAANFDVFAFAFVALQRYIRKAADSVGDVGVGQAGDDVGREDVDDVIGVEGAVDGFQFSALAGSVHLDAFVGRGDRE